MPDLKKPAPKKGSGSAVLVRVTGEMRTKIDAEVGRTGRSMSSVVEYWLERATQSSPSFVGLQKAGLTRAEAAFVAGVSPGTFDKMVDEGLLPRPRRYGTRLIFLRSEIELALFDLPTDGEARASNPWDEL